MLPYIVVSRISLEDLQLAVSQKTREGYEPLDSFTVYPEKDGKVTHYLQPMLLKKKPD